MTPAEKIKKLRKEAAALNNIAKSTVNGSGRRWLKMDAKMTSDFNRYLSIQSEISHLQLGEKR